MVLDRSLWSEEELRIIDEFGGLCIDCLDNFDTLHELIPKSLNKNWKDPENRVPLCKECHRKAHDIGTKKSKVFLEKKREELRKSIKFCWKRRRKNLENG